jgi:TIR domain
MFLQLTPPKGRWSLSIMGWGSAFLPLGSAFLPLGSAFLPRAWSLQTDASVTIRPLMLALAQWLSQIWAETDGFDKPRVSTNTPTPARFNTRAGLPACPGGAVSGRLRPSGGEGAMEAWYHPLIAWTTPPPEGHMASHIERQKFLATLGGAAAWPLAALAQQPERMRRLGALLPTTADIRKFRSASRRFLQGLQELAEASAAIALYDLSWLLWLTCQSARWPKFSFAIVVKIPGGYAGRIQDRLAQALGSDVLFMDVDAIPLGANFVRVLHDEVAKCEVLLAVIGRNWLDARDEHGDRRLDNPNDFVRVEIEAALQRNIPVVPILVDGARIPDARQLPKELEELSLRNGIDVRLASFHNDVSRLIHGLKTQLNIDIKRRQEISRLAFFCAIGTGYYIYLLPSFSSLLGIRQRSIIPL